MRIQDREIGQGHAPFVIAEMSGNHNQSFDRALAIVEAAARAGAHAIKLQTYTADTMTLDLDQGEFFISDPDSLWNGQSLFQLYQQAHTPWEWQAPLFQRAQELGLIAFSSPFDRSAVDFLEDLRVPAYKIASFEIVDLPLIEYAASTGKPLIISTGMANLEEIADAVTAARNAGGKDIALLHCVSGYPTPPEESNLRRIPALADRFGCPIGLSDHTLGIEAAVASVALGATMIEKHVTLARDDGGTDAAFSLEPNELASLVTAVSTAHMALGSGASVLGASEEGNRFFRRSLYVVGDVKAGETFTEDNVRSIRPGRGLPPKLLTHLLGKKAARDIRMGTPMSMDLVDAN